MSLRFTIFAALIVASSSASATHATSVDKDGCWDGRDASEDKCIKQVGHTWDNGKITVTYRNTCSQRIYAAVCHRQKASRKDCGAFGIRGNSEYKWYTYNATGDISFNAVGSVQSSYDWVCKSRWNMDVK